MVSVSILRPSGATLLILGADPQAYAMWLLSYALPGLVYIWVRLYELYLSILAEQAVKSARSYVS